MTAEELVDTLIKPELALLSSMVCCEVLKALCSKIPSLMITTELRWQVWLNSISQSPMNLVNAIEEGCSMIRRLTILFASAVLFSTTAFGHALFDNPAGSFELDWSNEQVKRTSATGVFNTMGLRVDNDPQVARVTEEGEVQGIALTFDIDDAFAFDIDETVTVSITLDVTGVEFFYIAYDRNGGPDGRRTVTVPKDTSGWQTLDVELDRARFANRGFAGTDFAIASGIDMASQVLTIRDLSFRRHGKSAPAPAMGLLELSVIGLGTNQPITAQVGLYDASGRMPLPAEGAVELQIFDQFTRNVEVREELDNLSWPHVNRYSFYVEGSYRAVIPAGEYDLVVLKGPEYRIETQRVTVPEIGMLQHTVGLAHRLNLSAEGWYSGDVHNHFSRPDASWNPKQVAHARAHDVHMHWLYQLGNSVATHFHQFAFGQAGQYRDRDYFLGSGQEDPRTDYLGHMLSMGQAKQVRHADDYLRYDRAARAIQELGGIAGIAHMDFAQFWQDVALALLAPDGLVNFVEVMQYNTVNTRDWYRFLNMGFHLPAAAGSDWPYMSLPGTVRTYVKIDGAFSPEAWNAGLAAGQSFVSNAPALEFTINGRPMGAKIDVNAGEKLMVQASARIEPTWDRLTRLELIRNGEVIETVSAKSADGADVLTLTTETVAGHGAWFAVRTEGLKHRDIVFQTPYTMRTQAHSSPIYVSVDGGPSADPATAVVLIDAVLERLEWFKGAAYARNDNEAWESPDRTEELVEVLRPSMHQWVNEKMDWYRVRQAQLRGESSGNVSSAASN